MLLDIWMLSEQRFECDESNQKTHRDWTLVQGIHQPDRKNTMVAHILSASERRRFIRTFLVATLLILAASIASKAAELNAETLRSWNDYVQAQTARVSGNSRVGHFLWSEQSPDQIRRVRNGEILIAPIGENPKIVPHGLIHHWIGTIFLPRTTLEDVLSVVRDYDKYQSFYAPNVFDSKLLHKVGTDDAFALHMLNNAVVTKFALDAEFQTSYKQLDESRWYSVGHSTRIREVEQYGQPNQHELPPDTGHGFIWRLYNVARFQQQDGGVYVELEAAALSRDVPAALRWAVNPAVRRASRGSLLVSLQKTQEAILANSELASRSVKKQDQIEKTPRPADSSSLATEWGNGFVSRRAWAK